MTQTIDRVQKNTPNLLQDQIARLKQLFPECVTEGKKGYELNPDFKELWQRIARRTRYRVQLDVAALIEGCAEAVRSIHIEPIKIRTEPAGWGASSRRASWRPPCWASGPSPSTSSTRCPTSPPCSLKRPTSPVAPCAASWSWLPTSTRSTSTLSNTSSARPRPSTAPWAIVFYIQDEFGDTREKLYLVRETKGTVDEDELRGIETMKIACARRHFETLIVDYDVSTNAEEFRQQILAKQQTQPK